MLDASAGILDWHGILTKHLPGSRERSSTSQIGMSDSGTDCNGSPSCGKGRRRGEQAQDDLIDVSATLSCAEVDAIIAGNREMRCNVERRYALSHESQILQTITLPAQTEVSTRRSTSEPEPLELETSPPSSEASNGRHAMQQGSLAEGIVAVQEDVMQRVEGQVGALAERVALCQSGVDHINATTLRLLHSRYESVSAAAVSALQQHSTTVARDQALMRDTQQVLDETRTALRRTGDILSNIDERDKRLGRNIETMIAEAVPEEEFKNVYRSPLSRWSDLWSRGDQEKAGGWRRRKSNGDWSRSRSIDTHRDAKHLTVEGQGAQHVESSDRQVLNEAAADQEERPASEKSSSDAEASDDDIEQQQDTLQHQLARVVSDGTNSETSTQETEHSSNNDDRRSAWLEMKNRATTMPPLF